MSKKLGKPATKEEMIVSVTLAIQYQENLLKLVKDDPKQTEITLNVIKKYKQQLKELQS